MTNMFTIKVKPLVTFITQNGSYPVVARSQSGVVPSGSHENFKTSLISFQTQNDMAKDIPVATIVLNDDYDWANLLKPNDYVRIDMLYNSNVFASEANRKQYTTLYCGLVSNLQRQLDANSNQRVYVVTVQGMAKVLQNIQLSTFSELTSTYASYQLIPDDAKQGIQFSKQPSAKIIEEIIDKFVLSNKGYTDYSYNDSNGKQYALKDLLVKHFEVNNEEAFMNQAYNKFTNYSGSILSMIKDASARPFNELFWTHEQGVATLNYRPTPFDPERWTDLGIISVDSSAVIRENISCNDTDQKSIFKLRASQDGANDFTGGFTGTLAPLTNQALIKRYGYALMEVPADYFNGTTPKNTKENKEEQENGTAVSTEGNTATSISYHTPTYENILDATVNRWKKNSKNDKITIPAEYGGDELYHETVSALKKYKSESSFANYINSCSAGLISSNKAQELWQFYSTNHDLPVAFYMQIVAPYYQSSISSNSNLSSFERVKKHPKYASEALMQATNYGLGSKQAYEVIETIIANNGTISRAEYQHILATYKYSDTEEGVDFYETTKDSGANSVPYLFLKYTQKLFNWYCDVSKMFSGTIVLNGTLGLELGKRLTVYSRKDNAYWQYYIESVSHQFSYTNGWYTTVGVTRGLPSTTVDDDEVHRFQAPYSFWGQYQHFVGGYFGERSLAESIEVAKEADEKDGGGGTTGDSSDVVQQAKKWLGWFHYGQVHPSPTLGSDLKNPKKSGYTDCSGFVWLVLNKCGYKVPSNMGWFTGSMASDAKGKHRWLKECSEKDAKAGDVLIYNCGGGSGNNGHTAILEEDWHGNSTKIIEMGGTGSGGVNEATVHDAFLSLLGGSRVLAKPLK